MLRALDVCNCYMYLFAEREELKDYEEKLLQKCFDHQSHECTLGHTQYYAYEPPFSIHTQNI